MVPRLRQEEGDRAMTTTTTAGGVNAADVPAKDAHQGGAPFSTAGVPAPPAQHSAAVGEGEAPTAAAPLVVGLDLSLSATGICHMRGQQLITDTIEPPKHRQHGLLRLRWLRTELLALIGHPDLLVIEGPSYRSFGQGSHDRAGLYWLLLDGLWNRGIPVAIAPPANLKQYATGKGGGKTASKDAVLLAAARRFPGFAGDNNAADALWLAAMGTAHLTGQHPVPLAHQAALTKVNWPTVGRAR